MLRFTPQGKGAIITARMRAIKSFKDVEAVLAEHIPYAKQTGSYTTDRIRDCLQRLGNPQDKYKAVHIAGTSGKTSTAYYMAALLEQGGAKTGLSPSPHVDHVSERLQIHLNTLNEITYCDYFAKFMGLISDLPEPLTYFELLVAFAYWVFAEEKVDYAVIEVGMGGLLDGTNVISRADKVCVLTDIGLDHVPVLGRSLGEIARQKAGIVQKGNSIFTYRQLHPVMEVYRDIIDDKHADLHLIEGAPPGTAPELPQILRRNWYLASKVYEYIAGRDGLPPLRAGQLQASRTIYIPARLETVTVQGKTLIMDGAHNSQKITALLSSLKEKYQLADIAVLMSLKANATPDERVELRLLTGVSHIILTSFSGAQDHPNVSLNPHDLAQKLAEAGFARTTVIEKPETALQALLGRPEPVLLVTGSFYLMNHIRPTVKRLVRAEV